MRDHPRPATVVHLRFFAGVSNETIAKELDLIVGTVKRDFAFARAWLARELKATDNSE
jgi:DNA-directed RNA polymerase specialized sigma24 family protein